MERKIIVDVCTVDDQDYYEFCHKLMLAIKDIEGRNNEVNIHYSKLPDSYSALVEEVTCAKN